MSSKNHNIRFNRAQIEWMKIYGPFEYRILDYLLFTSFPKEKEGSFYMFHVNKVAIETDISKAMVSRLFQKFMNIGFLTKIGSGQKSYFKFHYSKCCEYSVNKCIMLNTASENGTASNSQIVSIANNSVHGMNTVVHNGNETVHNVVPISKYEVVNKVVNKVEQSVPQSKVYKDSEEYMKLLSEIEYTRTFNLVEEMEKLIKENEQSLRDNNDLALLSLHLEQCRKYRTESDKRKNSTFNK